MTRRQTLIGLGLFLILATAASAAFYAVRLALPTVKLNSRQLSETQVAIDLTRPDARILSQHLARLPRDILRQPLLQRLLTEDFAFYYDDHSQKMALHGTLRRLAYEHQLTLQEQLLQKLLDAPADVSLWRSHDGRLGYWMLRLQTNLLSRTLTRLTTLSASDSQLMRIGELEVGGTQEPIYRLDYGYQRHLVFVSHAEHLLVLSDQGMLASDSGELTPEGNPALQKEQLALLSQALESGFADQQKALSLSQESAPAEQTLILDAHFLSFGYQHFFSGLQALRFDLGSDGLWRSHLLLDNQLETLDASALWQQAPAGAALCLSLPADWLAGKEVVQQWASSQDDHSGTAILDDLAGPLGICWYPDSRLASPLLMARFKSDTLALQHKSALKSLFERLIGAGEYIRGERFPVEEDPAKAGAYWRRVVSARYGSQLASKEPFRDQLSAARFFPVTLAVQGSTLFFSADGRLVDQALAVQQHTYPALAEKLAHPANTLAYVRPAQLSALLEREMYAALPGQIEPLFRQSARYYLQPRLQTLATLKPLSIQADFGHHFSLSGGSKWYPLQWQDEAP